MAVHHVIVDGSNLATEGRSLPSLAQLDQAVREFLAENPDAQVTVVVDASFGHRIDPSELPMFEEAEEAGEVASPPAGAIGRGDAFLLRIAEKTGATVLSNDSFQEFHGEHPWLFDDGRLIGGKPVPGVGWIFMPRAPVRGHKSREVVKEAKRKKRVEEAAETAAAATTGLDLAASRAKGRGKKVDRAIARATEEAVEPATNGRRRRRGSTPPAEPVNEPLAFITFIAAHPLGSEVVGTVTEFSSHGAFVEADGARCYLPLSAMGDPPPRRAREAVSKGDERTFVVQALDPQRRGVELALPGFAHIAGGPTEETVEAEIHEKAAAPKRRRAKAATPTLPAAETGRAEPPVIAPGGTAAPEPAAPAKKAGRAKKAARPEAGPAPAAATDPAAGTKEAPAARSQTAGKKAPAKAAQADIAVAKETPAKRVAKKAARATKTDAGVAKKAPGRAAGGAEAAPTAPEPRKTTRSAKAAGRPVSSPEGPTKRATPEGAEPAKRQPADQGGQTASPAQKSSRVRKVSATGARKDTQNDADAPASPTRRRSTGVKAAKKAAAPGQAAASGAAPAAKASGAAPPPKKAPARAKQVAAARANPTEARSLP